MAVAVAVAVVVELNDEDELTCLLRKIKFWWRWWRYSQFSLIFLRANLSDTVNVDDPSTVPKCDLFRTIKYISIIIIIIIIIVIIVVIVVIISIGK